MSETLQKPQHMLFSMRQLVQIISSGELEE